MSHYGIDLGTSNCLVAKVVQNLDDTFDVVCLSDNEGNTSFPSVVYFENPQAYKVGYSGAPYLYENADSTVELVKVRLGKSERIEIIAGQTRFEKSPQELSSYLLAHLNGAHDNQISNAVITVPAFFDQSQKHATMQAATIAGMVPKFLIEEPTAAIMYHIFSKYNKSGFDFFGTKPQTNVLVFDFGGGTLDLSLISISKDNDEIIPKVLETGGDMKLGGNVIDFIFTRLVLQRLCARYPTDSFIHHVNDVFEDYYQNYIENNILKFRDGVSAEVKQFIFRLKRNLEQVKIKLSTEDKVRIVFESSYAPFTISRASFETQVLSCEDLNIYERMKCALNGISKTRKKVDEVLLIGGSAQIPFVKNAITEVFEEMRLMRERIILSHDFEQAVAKGAALQAAIADGVAISPFQHNKCESIVAHDIELDHAGNRSIFIPKGMEYPFKEKQQFSLKIGHALSEAVSFTLNEMIPHESGVERRMISSFQFYLPIYYTGDDITIYMNIDEAGLYQVEAIHSATKEAAEFESHKQYALSDKVLKTAINTRLAMVDMS